MITTVQSVFSLKKIYPEEGVQMKIVLKTYRWKGQMEGFESISNKTKYIIKGLVSLKFKQTKPIKTVKTKIVHKTSCYCYFLGGFHSFQTFPANSGDGFNVTPPSVHPEGITSPVF